MTSYLFQLIMAYVSESDIEELNHVSHYTRIHKYTYELLSYGLPHPIYGQIPLFGLLILGFLFKEIDLKFDTILLNSLNQLFLNNNAK